MVAEARRVYRHIRFEVADARDFDLEGSFDAAFSNAVLHWIKEPELVIACVRRALRPVGRFVAEFGGRGNVRAIVAGLEIVRRSSGASKRSCVPPCIGKGHGSRTIAAGGSWCARPASSRR